MVAVTEGMVEKIFAFFIIMLIIRLPEFDSPEIEDLLLSFEDIPDAANFEDFEDLVQELDTASSGPSMPIFSDPGDGVTAQPDPVRRGPGIGKNIKMSE